MFTNSIKIGSEINGYIFSSFLSHGGSSEIYLVDSIKYNKKFVSKVIQISDKYTENNLDQFDKECSALKKLDHPNIIKLYDHFISKKDYFLILEYCNKGSLSNLIQKNGPLDESEFFSLAKKLLSAIQYSHSQNIIHHDIKPDNILFDEYGRPVLADFGISIQSQINSKVSDFKCSLAYAPPEIILKKQHDPYKADIWSLGITFLYSLTGFIPYQNDTIDILKYSIINGKFKLMKKIPDIYSNLIKSMISMNPENRKNINYLIDILNELDLISEDSNQIQKKKKFMFLPLKTKSPSQIYPHSLISIGTKRSSLKSTPLPISKSFATIL